MNTPEGMKPFNLELALAGHRVVCRDMEEKDEVTGLRLFGNVLEVERNGVKEQHYLDGRYHTTGESKADLFMQIKKVKRWIAVYVKTNDVVEKMYLTRDDLFREEFGECSANSIGWNIIEIEIEQ